MGGPVWFIVAVCVQSGYSSLCALVYRTWKRAVERKYESWFVAGAKIVQKLDFLTIFDIEVFFDAVSETMNHDWLWGLKVLKNSIFDHF